MTLLKKLGGALGIALAAAAQGAEPGDAERRASLQRGLLEYQRYCATCHGAHADGKSKVAEKLNPPPGSLRTSTRTDEYVESIVRQGGAAMGRSQFMPPFGEELTHQQVKDVVVYLRSINMGTPRDAGKK